MTSRLRKHTGLSANGCSIEIAPWVTVKSIQWYSTFKAFNKNAEGPLIPRFSSTSKIKQSKYLMHTPLCTCWKNGLFQLLWQSNQATIPPQVAMIIFVLKRYLWISHILSFSSNKWSNELPGGRNRMLHMGFVTSNLNFALHFSADFCSVFVLVWSTAGKSGHVDNV